MLQTIPIDSRQIPKKKEVTANKNYNDLVYGWLQAHSEWDNVKGHCRTISKKAVKFSSIAKDTGLCRQTVSSKFKSLINLGLVTENQENNEVYNLVILEKDAAMLIDRETLEVLISAMNTDAITTYVYLYSRYYANGCKGYEFQLEHLKEMVGLSAENRGSTSKKFQNILVALEQLGLLEYEYKTCGTENGIKSKYRVISMQNKFVKKSHT